MLNDIETIQGIYFPGNRVESWALIFFNVIVFSWMKDFVKPLIFAPGLNFEYNDRPPLLREYYIK